MTRIYAVKDHYHVLGMCSTLESCFTFQKKARLFLMCKTPLSVPQAAISLQAAAAGTQATLCPRKASAAAKGKWLSFKWESLNSTGKDRLQKKAQGAPGC